MVPKFQHAYVHFHTFGGNKNPCSRVAFPSWVAGETIVIGRLYFVRQAATLLKFAKSTANPELSAVLIEKAADLKSRMDETTARDRSISLRAPDVEPEKNSVFRRSAGSRQ